MKLLIFDLLLTYKKMSFHVVQSTVLQKFENYNCYPFTYKFLLLPAINMTQKHGLFSAHSSSVALFTN
jgi:hypothetical protein